MIAKKALVKLERVGSPLMRQWAGLQGQYNHTSKMNNHQIQIKK